MAEWYSKSNLRKAWHYAKLDSRDNFVFDVIDHSDIKHDIEFVLKSLEFQLRQKQYYPSPAIQIAVPKSEYSVRPGITTSLIDMIVCYALMQQIAPVLDKKLPNSAYAYRLNPGHTKGRQPLFDGMDPPTIDSDDDQDHDDFVATFPYDWFQNWIRFHTESVSASKEHEYVAVTDITAFFENISIKELFDQLRVLLGDERFYLRLVDHLQTVFNYWDWSCSDNKIPDRGLPQGNDISSFLSNVYLLPLDRAILDLVSQDVSKYHRYVDDIKVFTSNYDEARQGLLVLERELRRLSLNVQTAKTRIVLSTEVFDADVLECEERLSKENPDRLNNARQLVLSLFDTDSFGSEVLQKWGSIYRNCLTILGEARDESAIPIALSIFCRDPSHKNLSKNFIYLRQFVSSQTYENELYAGLTTAIDPFPFHRAFLYRLAAYSRGEHQALKDLAIRESMSLEKHWFSRMAALLFLSTVALVPSDLAQISEILDRESNGLVLRAAFVVASQHGGQPFWHMLEKLSYFNAPHQQYLHRYFAQLSGNRRAGNKALTNIDRSQTSESTFIHHLHRLDLVKANTGCRSRFRTVIDNKLNEVTHNDWPRLTYRLESIQTSFIENPTGSR